MIDFQDLTANLPLDTETLMICYNYVFSYIYTAVQRKIHFHNLYSLQLGFEKLPSFISKYLIHNSKRRHFSRTSQALRLNESETKKNGFHATILKYFIHIKTSNMIQ